MVVKIRRIVRARLLSSKMKVKRKKMKMERKLLQELVQLKVAKASRSLLLLA
jgi:hypothetical protein